MPKEDSTSRSQPIVNSSAYTGVSRMVNQTSSLSNTSGVSTSSSFVARTSSVAKEEPIPKPSSSSSSFSKSSLSTTTTNNNTNSVNTSVVVATASSKIRRGLQGGGWEERFTVDDVPYYYNPSTDCLSWEKPDCLRTEEEKKEGSSHWVWLEDPEEAWIPVCVVGS